MSTKPETMLRSLRSIEALYTDDKPQAGRPNVSRIAHDAADCIESLIKKPETGMNELALEIHANAISHGWWDGAERKLPEILMLIVSELAEALEEHRNGRPMLYHECNALKEPCATAGEGAERECKQFAGLEDDCVEWNPKPEGIAIELADAVIRILDFCGQANIDIESAIRLKHEYNKTRPYRHGGKAC